MDYITYKTMLAQGKPYQTTTTEEYLKTLSKNRLNIHAGEFGIYIAREIIVNAQRLYFPFIDIDGVEADNEEDKIKSAIENLKLTIRCLKKLGADQYFSIIATGGTGFRMFSPILLNYDDYQAFVQLIKNEMSHIHDLDPTKDIEMPHQLFVYKGNSRQNVKTLVDRSSVAIDQAKFEHEEMSPEEYKTLFAGKFDPDLNIEFMRSFFERFNAISDLCALGQFGEKIAEYRGLINELNVSPFRYIRQQKNRKPISLDVLSEMLQEKGLANRLEKRGNKEAISFKGLPCPSCGKTTANAVAYPSGYKLRCFNTNCNAHGSGLPLHEWSGIKGEKNNQETPFLNNNLKAPTDFTELKDARHIIKSEIQTDEDVLLLITPGVGKTHVALETLAEMASYKQILFSSFNKRLQDESYQKIRNMCPSDDVAGYVHKLSPREDFCQKSQNLKEVIAKGYSPSEILCTNCEHRPACSYFEQKKGLRNGIFFVTHHMLQYLESIFSKPDLIVLDENLVSGFLMEESVTETQMRSLRSICKNTEFKIVNDIISLGKQIGDGIIMEKAGKVIINSRKLLEKDYCEDTIVGLLAQKLHKTENDIIGRIDKVISTIEAYSRSELYKENVNLGAVNWLKGLIYPDWHSYLLIMQNGECFFNMKQITPFKYPETPVKILDATGDEKVVQAILNREVKTKKVDVNWNSRRVHIKKDTTRNVISWAKDSDLKKLITDMLAKISGDKVFVITYKQISGKVLEICKQLEPQKEFYSYYFHGPRGINDFAGCEAVMVLGLPYANLNSTAQNAYLLFPGNENKDVRESWVEANMMWELIQMIHRIRPINKDLVELVIAGSSWPSILPEPDKTIDKSYTYNKEYFIQILDPFVKEFGFLNPDILFLANVYEKSKTRQAQNFREKVFDVLRAYSRFYDIEKLQVELKSSPLFPREDLDCDDIITSTKIWDLSEEKEFLYHKLILVLYIFYYKNLLKNSNQLPLRLLQLYNQHIDCVKNIPTINLSNSNQWAELKNHFKKKYPHFESFKIKLPHARGNAVHGVGQKDKVVEFYNGLNDFEIFGTINTETYQTTTPSPSPRISLPEDCISVFIPPGLSYVAHIGISDQVIPIGFNNENTGFKDVLIKLCDSPQKKIITNNGVFLAKMLIEAELRDFEIIDVLLNEKIIRNGEVELNGINLKYLFGQYGLIEEADVNLSVSQMYQAWQYQEEVIQQLGLNDIAELERKILWLAADIEQAGLGVDIDRLLQHQEEIQNADNYEFSSELQKLEKIISMVGNDDRVRDTINSLNTKTGRFYRDLQTVPKGDIRKFFCAPDGYDLVITDYSSQEARIMIGLAGVQKGLNILQEQKDIYLEVAKEITGKSEEECHQYRDMAKKIVIGLNNGESNFSIYLRLNKMGYGFDLEDVTKFIFRYFNGFSGIKQYQENVVDQAYRDGFIKTSMGRRMAASENTKARSLCNFPITATASDGFKLALLAIDKKLKNQNLDARIVHIMHDEVIVEAAEGVSQEVADIVKTCMENSFSQFIPNVPFVVEPEIRKTWG